jgi:hypothetical protein
MSFDAFVSYNSKDRDAVVSLVALLVKRGLRIFFDVAEIRPGERWHSVLERAIEDSRCILVTIGKSGIAPWQDEETRAYLLHSVEANRSVIPVLLPDSPIRVDLPVFLRTRTWIDFRDGFTSPVLEQLIWGITGRRPQVFTPSIGESSLKARARLEEVFRTSGLPNYTYVEPSIYGHVALDIRQKAKHVLLSGPSGSGKTCLVFRLLEEMAFRRERDYIYISALDETAGATVRQVLASAIRGLESRLVIVDDFHLLPKELRSTLGSGLKQLADEAFSLGSTSTFVLLGIPSSGEALLFNTSDLGPRLGVYSMPVATVGDLSRLLQRGEERLAIEFINRDSLAREANGSYYICQYLAQVICLNNQVTATEEGLRQLSFEVAIIRNHLVMELETRFRLHIVAFVKNAGASAHDRLPFAILLALIAAIPKPTISSDELLEVADQFRTALLSVKSRIFEVIASSMESGRFGRYIYFDEDADIFSIEDPIFRYFLTFHDFKKVIDRCGLAEAQRGEIVKLWTGVRGHYILDDSSASYKLERNSVFVCYSHTDRKWLEALQVVLKPLVRDRTLDFWTDARIEPGQSWRDEIGSALKRARVAILLVSQHFLASDFIAQEELPPLLDRASRDGLRIIWVPISASLYDRTALARYQAASDPQRPLDTLSSSQRNKKLVEIARHVQRALEDPHDGMSDKHT